MRFILLRLLIVLSLTFLLSCTGSDNQSFDNSSLIENPTYGKWQDREQMPISIELEQIFGAETEEQGVIFSSAGNILGPVADSLNNIYILDRERAKLISFTEDGSLRWETGEKGQGPGAFEKPRGLATDGEFLYMDNVSRSRIDKFDMQGNYINSFTLDHVDLTSTEVEGFLPGGLLVTTSTLWGALGTQVNILDLSEEISVISRFDIRLADNLDLGEGLSSGINITIIDSLIVAGNNTDYRIQFFNQNGVLVKIIQRDFDKIVRPGFYQSGGSRGIMSFGSLTPPIKLPNDFLLTTVSWPKNVNDPDQFARNRSYTELNFATSIDLFDEEGILLYSQEQEGRTLPEIGRISYVDHNGKVYIKSNDPFPRIRRYSITIDK